jgi:type II secretory pathway pseudopilin PulG
MSVKVSFHRECTLEVLSKITAPLALGCVRREIEVNSKNQLWILLAFFALIGVFSGLAIWQINQSQQKERELTRAKTQLQQIAQQMQVLKEQNATALSDKGKLIKDLGAAKKQLTTFQQKGIELEQRFKAAQDTLTKLATENSNLKIQLAETSKKGTTFQQAPTPSQPTSPPKAELRLPR